MQVTIIGGGSYQWSPKLIADLLSLPSLSGVHLVLEDIDPAPLAKMEAIAHIADDKLGAKSTVSTTTDQRRALDGADFVVVTISTGGFTSMAVDIDVPARHGIRQSVGDSIGPGGISRALRNIPVLAGIGHDMEEQCPDAWLLNITNPMTTPDPRRVPGDHASRPSGCATRSAASAWTWPSPSASPTPPCDP